MLVRNVCKLNEHWHLCNLHKILAPFHTSFCHSVQLTGYKLHWKMAAF